METLISLVEGRGRNRSAWLALLALFAQGCAEQPSNDDVAAADATVPGVPGAPRAAGEEAPPEPRDDHASNADPIDGRRADAAASTAPSDPGCRTFVSDSLIDHACFHALMGPYREQAASAAPTTPGHDVDRPHTAYQVALPEQTPGTYTGHLTYEARRAGAYAIFSANVATLTVQSAAAEAIPTFLAHPTEICRELPDVRGYRLEAGRHALHVTSSRPQVTLVVEFMDEGATEDGYRFECATLPMTPDSAAAPVTGEVEPAAQDGGGAAHAAEAGAVPSAASDPPSASGDPRPAAANEPAPSPAPTEPPDTVAEDPSDPPPATTPAPSDPEIGEPAASTVPPVPAPSCVIDPVLEHACLHVTHGPYATVDATAEGATPRLLSQPHTAYTVRFPDPQGGSVSYRPTTSGEFVIYLGAELSLALRTGMADEPPIFVEPVTGCTGLVRAYVFTLQAGTRYDLRLGADAAASATVLVESVDALTASGWASRTEPCPK